MIKFLKSLFRRHKPEPLDIFWNDYDFKNQEFTFYMDWWIPGGRVIKLVKIGGKNETHNKKIFN